MSNDLEETMAPRYLIGNWPHVLNMANSIIGVSVLALPFCFKQCGILLGFLLLMGSAWLTRLTCHLLMKSAFATKKRSYEYLAFHIFGRAGKLLVELSIIGLLIGTCIAFYIIIGDLGPAVVSKVTGLENTPQLRSVLLVFLTCFIVVPLAMLHSLDSLSNFSAISLTFYCVFVAEVIIAAFPNLWSGIWVSKVVFWNTDGVFKCLPIFALCFACQTQLFIMSDALPEPSLNRINKIVHSAVLMCSVIYVSVGCFGYIAFCDDYISGDILMNFSPTFFSEAIKVGFVTSTLISFPLVIFPCRASLYTLLFVRKGLHDNFGGAVYIPPTYFKGITISIIGVTLTIGLLVPNIEFMLAITGATMGSLICYILPAVLFITAISVDHGGNTRSFAQLVLLIGVTILLASSYVTLTAEEKVVKHESVVKLGQPIEHNEDNLPIHNDEELKKKLEEMKDQLPPVNGKPDGIDPGGAIDKDVVDAVTAGAVVPPVKLEVIDSVTVLPLVPVVDKSKQVDDVVDKSKQVDVVDNSKEIEVVDKSKEVEVVDKKLPDTEVDKRKEPPNPHAPPDELIIQEKIEDMKKDIEAVGNQSKEEDSAKDKNRNLVERSIDSEPKKSAEKQIDEKVTQVMDGQQQALYGRPALVDVLQPKLESQPMPHGGKETVNEKMVDSEGKPQPGKNKDVKLGMVEGKVVEADGVRSVEVQNGLMAKNPDLQNVPEVQHVPETRKDKAPVPDEQPGLQKTMHVMNESAKAADVDAKVASDQHADVDQHEAKIIIAELKKQQQEQRILLDEHRKILDELKRHQIEVHQEAQSENSKGQDQPLGDNAADKTKPKPVHKEKRELPADSLEKEEKTGKVVPKVSSREEHSKGERAEPDHKNQEKRDLPADSFEKGDKTVVSKVSSREEHSKGEKVEPDHTEKEKRELPADSLKKVEETGKVVPKVSSREEQSKAEKIVVKATPKAAKESNENPNKDNSNPQLNENSKVVKENVVDMEKHANENLNIQNSNDHGNKNGKAGDVNKNAPEMERHPDAKHNDISDVDNRQNQNIPKHDHVRNTDDVKQSQSHHEDEIVLKEEKLDFVANEKLISSQTLNRSQNNIPVFVSKKSLRR